MEKNKRGLTQAIEFSVPIPFEDARSRLHDLTNRPFRGSRNKLKVDETLLKPDICVFRVWVFPIAIDVEVNGFLKRRTETETLVIGKTGLGCFSYYLPMAWLALAVYILIISRDFQKFASFLFVFLIAAGVYRSYLIGSCSRLAAIVEKQLRL